MKEKFPPTPPEEGDENKKLPIDKFQENAKFYGDDVEQAYAKLFGTKPTNPDLDAKGLDIPTGNPEIPYVQVKSSLVGARKFFLESLKRKKFIPIVIGEPGTKEEVIESIKEFGGWVGKDEDGREKFLQNILGVRNKIDELNGLA